MPTLPQLGVRAARQYVHRGRPSQIDISPICCIANIDKVNSGPTFGTTTAMANAGLGVNLSTGQSFNPIFNTGGPRNFQFALKLFF